GFLLKDTLPEDLITAIRVVAAGEALLAPSVTRRLISEFARTPALGLPDGTPGLPTPGLPTPGLPTPGLPAPGLPAHPGGAPGRAPGAWPSAGPGPARPGAPAAGRADGNRVTGLLTDRECEVLRLVAAGMSNGEIADHLHISPATAKTHVAHL